MNNDMLMSSQQTITALVEPIIPNEYSRYPLEMSPLDIVGTDHLAETSQMLYYDDLNRGYCPYIPASTHYFEGSNAIISGDVSWSVWAKQSGGSSVIRYIMIQKGVSNRGIFYSADNIGFYTRDSTGAYKEIKIPFTNTEKLNWNNFIVTQTGTIVKLYINKVLRGTLDIGSTYTFSGKFVIGRHVDLNQEFFNGWIKDVRTVQRGITQEEVDEIYDYEVAHRNVDLSKGISAFYPLQSNSNDTSGNNLNAVDVGIVSYDGQSVDYTPAGRSDIGDKKLPRQQNYTLNFWMKKGIDTGESYAFVHNYRYSSSAGGYRSGYRIETISGSNIIRYGVNAVTGIHYSQSTMSFDTSKFENIGVVIQAGLVSFYINGIFSNSEVVPAIAWSSLSSYYQTEDSIGGGYLPSHSRTYLFDGQIANFSVREISLSAKSMLELHNQEKGDFI